MAMAIWSTTDVFNFGPAFDAGPKIEGRRVVLEILNIYLWRHEVGSIVWKSEVGKGREVFGGYKLKGQTC